MTAEGLCFGGLSILLPSASCLDRTHQSFHNGTDFPRAADPKDGEAALTNLELDII